MNLDKQVATVEVFQHSGPSEAEAEAMRRVNEFQPTRVALSAKIMYAYAGSHAKYEKGRWVGVEVEHVDIVAYRHSLKQQDGGQNEQ